MNDARRFLTEEEVRSVEEAISQAEARTAAEFVCAVATESGRYDRAESILGLISALALLAVTYRLPGLMADSSVGEWAVVAPPGLVWLSLAVAVGFVLGNVLATYVHGLRRFFVSQTEIEQEVLRAASHVFAQRRVACTEAQAGVLIYVSLFEHRVVILCDQQAMKVLQQSDVEALRDIAVGQLKAGQRGQTFLTTLEAASGLLAERLPPPPEGEQNELPNDFVIFHPRP